MKTTKELARELGLLRKRTLSAPGSNKHTSSSRQPFGYLVVLDFESTCWKEKKFRTQEIIEFPAVLLNTATGDIESEFQYYVQPQEQPILSEFCRELTGITQEQVDEGIPLRLCLKKFSKWLDNLCKEKGITFSPVQGRQSNSKAATFVTWSDWDLGVCLFNECRRKQLLKPSQLNSWIDLRATYRKFYNRRPQGLNGALQDLGITFEGREHSGLHDSRNTARLAWRMTKDGCILTTTKTLQPTGDNSCKAGFSTATDRIKTKTSDGNGANHPAVDKTKTPTKGRTGANLTAVNTTRTPTKCGTGTHLIASETPKTVKNRENFSTLNKAPTAVHALNSPSRSPCHKKRKTDTRVSPSKNPVATMVSSPKTARSKIPVWSPKAAYNGRTVTSAKQSIADQIYRDPSTEETSTGGCVSKPVDKKQLPVTFTGLRNRDNNTTNTQHVNQPSARDITAFKTPQLLKTTTSGQSNNSFKTLSNNSSFKTPNSFGLSLSRISSSYLDSSRGFTGQENLYSVSGYVTPINSSTRLSNNTSSCMKATAPMCKCGKRSKRRMAQTPGPNMGRFFFTCGAGSRHNTHQDQKKGCDFFKWESTDFNSSKNSSFQNNRTNTGLPFKQVGLKSGFSQRKSLGVRSVAFKTPIR